MRRLFKTAQDARIYLGSLGYYPQHTRPHKPQRWIHPETGTLLCIAQYRKPPRKWFVMKYPAQAKGLRIKSGRSYASKVKSRS